VSYELSSVISSLVSNLARLAESDPESDNTTWNLQVSSADRPDHASNSGTPPVSELDMYSLFRDERAHIRGSIDAIPASGLDPSTYQNTRGNLPNPCASGAQIIPAKSWAASEPDFPGADYISSQTADDWTSSDIYFPVEANIGSQAADAWRGFANYIDSQTTDAWTASNNYSAGASYVSSQTVDAWTASNPYFQCAPHLFASGG
jgi:hypothetical protein